MKQYKLLFLDIDGTILKYDDTIEESTKIAIAKMQQTGLEVFLATGRPIHEIAEIGKELHIQSFIGYNGALATLKGKTVFKEPINPDIVDRYIKIAKERNNEIILYTSEKNLITNVDSQSVKDFIKYFRFQKNEPYSPQYNNDIIGMTIIDLNEKDISLYEKDSGAHLAKVNVEGIQQCYDAVRDKINKGYAVNMILDHFGLAKETAIAFGDGMNDKEMLSSVEEGFAMGNAQPELFAYANRRTTDVNHSGVYNGLKVLGLLK
ncbi:HAD family phosphatase [Bacillaceae bacterium Marseille-Q3522]|nr:HAD family phosphatase [Bacillaceae bacterium Marseille-Q3522]